MVRHGYLKLLALGLLAAALSGCSAKSPQGTGRIFGGQVEFAEPELEPADLEAVELEPEEDTTTEAPNFADEALSDVNESYQDPDNLQSELDTSVQEDTTMPSVPDMADTTLAEVSESTADKTATETATTQEPAPVKEKPKWIPVKKVAAQSFKKRGILVNSVYIARSGDSLQSIAQKIYRRPNQTANQTENQAAEKTAELLKINPWLKKHTKVGTKVYYNSPNNPKRSGELFTYYEDIGAPAKEYVSQEGENIRDISKKLLGHKNSWHEIWAINLNVESKWKLPKGTKLVYWPEGAESSGSVAVQAQADSEVEPTPSTSTNEDPSSADTARAESGGGDPAMASDPNVAESAAEQVNAAQGIQNVPPDTVPDQNAKEQEAMALGAEGSQNGVDLQADSGDAEGSAPQDMAVTDVAEDEPEEDDSFLVPPAEVEELMAPGSDQTQLMFLMLAGVVILLTGLGFAMVFKKRKSKSQ